MSEETDSELERRIRERAFQVWIDEGQPYGRQREHWEIAKLAITQEDAQTTALAAGENSQQTPTKPQGRSPQPTDKPSKK